MDQSKQKDLFGIPCTEVESPSVYDGLLKTEPVSVSTNVRWEGKGEVKDESGKTLSIKKQAYISEWIRYTYETLDKTGTYDTTERKLYLTDETVFEIHYLGTRYDDEYGDSSTSYMLLFVDDRILIQMMKERLAELIRDWEEENPRRYRKFDKPTKDDALHAVLCEICQLHPNGTHCQHSYDCCGNFYYSSPTFEALRHYDPNVGKYFIEISGHRNV